MKKESKVSKSKIQDPNHQFELSQKIISRIESKLDGEFLVFWLVPSASIHDVDATGFYNLINAKKSKKKCCVFIRSTGGSGMVSLRLVNMIRDKFSEVTALITSDCTSASTMLALGANDIQMSSRAYLSAVDTSLVHELSPTDKFNTKVRVSLDELHRVTRLWSENSKNDNSINPYEEIFKYIHPLVIGAVDRASSLSYKICTEILSYHMKDKTLIDKISETLNNEYPQHGYPITMKEAKRIGINAIQMDYEVEELLTQLDMVYQEASDDQKLYENENKYEFRRVNRIFERSGSRFFYEWDEENNYRAEEKRWITARDDSSWYCFNNEYPAKPKKLYLREF